MKEISQDKLWAIYETLPNELKDAIFSEDTADAIWNICKLHNVEQISDTAKIVGHSLMGLLPPETIAATLQSQLGLSQNTAKKMGMEIEHFIFNSIKEELNSLYQKKSQPEERLVAKKEEGVEEKEIEEKEIEEETRQPQKLKSYREPIE